MQLWKMAHYAQTGLAVQPSYVSATTKREEERDASSRLHVVYGGIRIGSWSQSSQLSMDLQEELEIKLFK